MPTPPCYPLSPALPLAALRHVPALAPHLPAPTLRRPRRAFTVGHRITAAAGSAAGGTLLDHHAAPAGRWTAAVLADPMARRTGVGAIYRLTLPPSPR